MLRSYILPAVMLSISSLVSAQKVEMLPFGDFNNWLTRNIKESRIIGGNQKQCFEVAPTATVVGDAPYTNRGGSPWATSNVMAKVCGVTKVSNMVFPDERSAGNKCAKLTTGIEECKAMGVVNVKVLVSGSMFLGEMLEPVKSTSDPYSKMVMGIPYTKRPVALRYDYKLVIPDGDMIYSSGFSKEKVVPGKDKAEVVIYLQRRWEDAAGNVYAKRVGTGCEQLGRNTAGWVNDHRLKVRYGDISSQPGFSKRMNLIPEEKSYYTRNSKGKMVPVVEVGWDDADATPTHMIVMFSSGSGEPYTGTPGTTMWVDNAGLIF
ncbi:MAG: glycoside hydrolase xylanase [Bacteroidales bacterium]|nr:glycoside hydrolase xylanase [Bacteroidales bacterium]